MRVSVICTLLNEGESVRRLLDSLCQQTRQPDEIVIVDGGSRDSTIAHIQAYSDRLPIKLLVEAGANISRGRNIAIAAASGDVIAATDAGVWLEPAWLERLVTPFEQQSGTQSVAGFFVADPQTAFEAAMGATVLPGVDDVDPATFLPSSRSVAFTRTAWEAAGGYPEWLDYCEDLILDFRMRDAVGPFAWAPEAVAHFRPRPSLRAFLKQYYRYARGDGKADLWRRRHIIRYVTYLVGFPSLLFLGMRRNPAWLVALLVGAAAYCRAPYRRLQPGLPALSPFDRLRTLCLVPVIRAAGDLAKMLGYPAGWVWRIKNWRRPEIHWR